jgi:D-glycero-D-manno-heptose 1,7-bisphosphate phosphatase
MSIRRALFLDRDGVINHDLGYTSCVEDFVFIEGIFDLCRAAHIAKYLLIVATNQAGIGRGFYTEEDFSKLTKWMSERFETEGAKLTEVFYCPHHPEHGIGRYKCDSFDRKPNPGMLLNAAGKYGIDLAHSIMIGDKDSDMLAAKSAGVGIRCHYLAADHQIVQSSASTHKVHSLPEAATLLKALPTNSS